MSNTLTYDKTSHGNLITYANNEWAWVQDDNISSCTRHSTAISFWVYYPKSGKLAVQYKSSPTFYHYEGVPFSVMFALMSADSLGNFIAKEVKPNYSVA